MTSEVKMRDNWHRHHVAVEKAALQMIRNALRTDAEAGRSVRAEMLEMLDAATHELQSQSAAIEAARVEARAKALEEAANIVYEMGGSGWDCATIVEKLRSLAKEAP